MWDFVKFKNNIAMEDDMGNSVSYSDLFEGGNELYAKIGKRCLAVCLCKNSIGSVFGYASFIRHHVVPVLLSASMDAELLKNIVLTYLPSYLWVPEDMENDFSKTEKVFEKYGYVLLKTGFEKSYELNDELGLLLTTSGSTGSPKLVRQSYTNIFDNAESISRYLELSENERPISTLPMNYTYGLSIINSHLLVGAKLLLTEKTILQKDFWNFFRSAEATSFGGVPYTYEILTKMRFERMALPSLRTMTQAGGKLLPDLHEKFAVYAKEHQVHFFVMYGQCEATARMGYLPYDKAIEKKGSMGIAIPGGEFILMDLDGNVITKPYVDGELVYKGKNVTLGYAECGDDLKKDDERNGLLHTGDIAYFDDDKYFYISGRLKRFLKVFGNRVNLDEIDRMIKSHFQVECASTGTDDHVVIYVTDKDIKNEIHQFISEKTGLNRTAFEIRYIPQIPKNESGKILYKELNSLSED